ncbi:hypothetical protein E2C01_061440 [Portunus trituberculatus]|uniref:Uncharacterized protein n=1 Tax=Portunus trituberculatus TaxID=210409 RepID=A0A5B7HD69_PORTR|nr:hypothetical protein [Portunus trituberculatus]
MELVIEKGSNWCAGMEWLLSFFGACRKALSEIIRRDISSRIARHFRFMRVRKSRYLEIHGLESKVSHFSRSIFCKSVSSTGFKGRPKY